MKLRIALGVLWAATGWYAGTFFSGLFELDVALAPILAVPGPVLIAVGAIIAERSRSRVLDRRHVLADQAPAAVGPSRPLETSGV